MATAESFVSVFAACFCRDNNDKECKMIDFDEILKQAQETKPISEYIDCKTGEYKGDISFAGVYIFWFGNSDKKIKELERNLKIKGPKGKEQNLTWNWNLDNEKICLYVGKSTNIKKRLGQHLCLKIDSLAPIEPNKLNKRTTGCQFRAGFDYLYQGKNVDIFERMNKRIHLAILPDEDFIRRFYIEDFLIGKLLPWFNLDSER